MILNSLKPEESSYKSRYHLSSFKIEGGDVHILGADPVIHRLVRDYLTGRAADVSADAVRNVYLNVPGHYGLIFAQPGRTTVATDPYGIVKFYTYLKDGTTIICDDCRELHSERFTLDYQAIKFFFVCNYTPSRHTFFKELNKLEPCTLYVFEQGRPVDERLYARVGEERLSGTGFLDRFQDTMDSVLSFYHNNYHRGCLFLSGGIDSSFLYKMLCTGGKKKWLDLLVGQTMGLAQQHKIDGDYDVEYALRLAEDHGQSISVTSYDISDPAILDDFVGLRNALFTEYAPALAYMAYVRTIDHDTIILNGQNADSVLSFGSMGNPHFKGIRIKGLNGFFSRYFHFFGPSSGPSALQLAARILRWMYFKINYAGALDDFSRRRYFLGIGLHPENKFFILGDPAFHAIADVGEMADWFESEYLSPLFEGYPSASDHALSVLLYNKTYMQGSANRATVLTALMQGRKIFLPYTALSLFELMTNLDPDWHYAFYGKYPNIAVGRRIGMPDYIIHRCDPDDSDSTVLLYSALMNNPIFASFLKDIIQEADWSKYEHILNARMIQKIKKYNEAISAVDMPTIMRFAWLESTLRRFTVK